jgi:hypothetical protein
MSRFMSSHATTSRCRSTCLLEYLYSSTMVPLFPDPLFVTKSVFEVQQNLYQEKS